ncbi:MAG: hypothetical protein MSF32_04090 [Dysosmobacter sp.]|nr:hypothetical protein [Dysosmobacter sp.]
MVMIRSMMGISYGGIVWKLLENRLRIVKWKNSDSQEPSLAIIRTKTGKLSVDFCNRCWDNRGKSMEIEVRYESGDL